MDYEKLYNEVLGRAKIAYKDTDRHLKASLERIFKESSHELRESEDEKIIRTLKEIVNWGCAKNISVENNVELKDCLAWIEKQGEQKSKTNFLKFRIGDKVTNGEDTYTINFIGKDCYLVKEHDCTTIPFEYQHHWKLVEQKPVDKAEPKFKVGDWVRAIRSGNIFKILSVNDGLYRVLCYDGVEANYPIEVEKDLAYWTIQDANDGDVLATDKSVFIYAKVLYNKPYAYCGVDKFGVFKDSRLEHNWATSVDNIQPTTKEQRDLLFQKMKEAGYEWDVDKKELTKIEQKPAEKTDVLMSLDEAIKHCNEVAEAIAASGCEECAKEYVQLADWLTELKELKEQKPSWSEEDEKIYQSILDDTVQENQLDNNQIAWLKSLKHRVQPQPKYQWTDEDEKNLRDLLVHGETKLGLRRWIAGLPEKMGSRSEYHWKPCEKQLEALRVASEVGTANNSWAMSVLKELLEELKLLKDYD